MVCTTWKSEHSWTYRDSKSDLSVKPVGRLYTDCAAADLEAYCTFYNYGCVLKNGRSFVWIYFSTPIK
jgi:hypothetical protein